MSKTIQAYDIAHETNLDVKFSPVAICPYCHTSHDGSTQQRVIYCEKIHPYLPYRMYVVHFCHACKQAFMVVYASQERSGIMRKFRFYTLPSPSSFSEDIKKLSPRFIKIYDQAEAAEKQHLDELSGMGYRKALEILIKDFQCHENPNEADKIQAMFLSDCIAMIKDNELNTIVKGCSWLGNSCAHYVDEYHQPDNEFLKKLLRNVVATIDKRLNYREALEIVNKKRST